MTQCPQCGTTQTPTSENALCERCGFSLTDTTLPHHHATSLYEIPWEHLETRRLLHSFSATVCFSMTRPSRFFSLLTEKSSLFHAVLFGLVAGSFGILADLVWEGAYAAMWEHLSDFGIDTQFQGMTATSLMFSPALLIMSLFMVSLYVHTLLILSRRKRASFKTTFKIVCYVQSASILSIIPFAGSIIGPFWGLYMLIAGTSAIHKISKTRAALTILTPLLILAFLAFFIVFAVLGTTVLSTLLLKEIVPFFR